jgi:hypothetical protein
MRWLWNSYPVKTRKTKRKRLEITKVMVSDRFIKRSNEGRETLIFEIIFFLSRKTVDAREIVAAKLAHGIRPTERYML